MLIDKVEVVLKSGNGGNGKASFRRNSKGPDGGNGGNGGGLYVEAVNNIFLLNQFSHINGDIILEAENGQPGGKNQKSGHSGSDLVIKLPVGTSIIDKKDHRTVYELNNVGEKVLICRGGRGGKGNFELRSADETTPKTAELGTKGQKLNAIFTLKLIADYGLIGLPNAGKSSLLNELTNANAKVANYNFTTLSPNLGVIKGKVIADIPGLIEGASEGRGLGIGFLKHIEKVSTLIHCISAESTDILKDYQTVRTELAKFNQKLLEKKEIVLITKTDLVEKSIVDVYSIKLKAYGLVIPVSIHDFESLEKVKKLIP
jgi:GTP-binding protein